MQILKNLQLLVAGLFKFVWPFATTWHKKLKRKIPTKMRFHDYFNAYNILMDEEM